MKKDCKDCLCYLENAYLYCCPFLFEKEKPEVKECFIEVDYN